MKIFYLVSLITTFMIGACKQSPNFSSIAEVSYIKDIQPIIISNCTQSNCHGDLGTQKFKLLTYDALISHGDVKANKPNESKLYTVIKTLNEEEIMPKKPFNQLTEKQIQIIYIWIGQGAKNN